MAAAYPRAVVLRNVRRVAQLLRKAEQAKESDFPVILLTGAGVSVAAGIPDFRSPGVRPLKLETEQIAKLFGRACWTYLFAVGIRLPVPVCMCLLRNSKMGNAKLMQKPLTSKFEMKSTPCPRKKGYSCQVFSD